VSWRDETIAGKMSGSQSFCTEPSLHGDPETCYVETCYVRIDSLTTPPRVQVALTTRDSELRLQQFSMLVGLKCERA
jgi:hypothetical protein